MGLFAVQCIDESPRPPGTWRLKLSLKAYWAKKMRRIERSGQGGLRRGEEEPDLSDEHEGTRTEYWVVTFTGASYQKGVSEW